MNAITEYSPIEAVIADLTARHKGVLFDVTKPEQMKAAKAAAKDISQYRIALEKKRVDLKADVLERGRLIDGEAKRISAQLAALEDPIVDQIKAEERRVEAEREAAIKAEQDRLAAEERARKEAEEKRLADERAKLAAEREAFERQQREAREKLQAEEDTRRKALAEEEERVRAARRAEDDRLRAEREAIDKERRAQEERERQARLALEQREREAKRKEQDRLDGRQMLETFVERYGDEPEFGAVAAAIRAYFERQRRRAA